MRLLCHLREIRGERKLVELARASGVSEPELSKIERGIALPRDAWLESLEEAYGQPRHTWWPPEVLVAISGDGA